MAVIKFNLLLFLNIFCVANSVRRIKDGEEVSKDKRYVVYLVKAPRSVRIYDEWLCGGALVSPWFIVTSAACVADVEHMYAIAGYKEYVRDSMIEENKCTKAKKKKVVHTCVPMKYELDFQKTEKWSFIDIALAKVESQYDLKDDSFKTLCSYIPTVIPINYENRFQKPGTDVLVYGWGHTEIWRQEGDHENYNQANMRYAASKIMDKTSCKQHYEQFASMSNIIDQYMICALTKGEINEKGELVLLGPPPPKLDGCYDQEVLRGPQLKNDEIVLSQKNNVPDECKDDDAYQNLVKDDTRRMNKNSNQTSSDLLQNKNRTAFNRTTEQSRKNGICQNDHGGPLVTWVGGKEILIGIASVFKVSSDFKCMGPYLYTSTQCNGAFLDCELGNSKEKGRRSICDSPPIQRGYDTVERNISWADHPAGPADNERNSLKFRDSTDMKSPQIMQRLSRFAMLAKLAKDQSNAILRTQRQRG